MNKYIFPAAAIIALASCGGNANKTAPGTDKKLPQEKVAEKVGTATWINDFRAFRDAVYQSDRKKVKEFVDFPITDQTINIWGIVYAGTKEYDTHGFDTIPFTEKDFDKFYDKLFTKTFIKCLLKIKSEELYKKGKVSSPKLEEEAMIHTLHADVSEDNTLTLNLSSSGHYTVEEGESDKIEFNVMFSFSILENGKIKLKKVMMAG